MATTPLVAHIPEPTGARVTRHSMARARMLAAAGFLGGVVLALLGFAWDVQWHTDVGPDTFFTAPHLVLYSGIAISGITCLGMVLFTTALTRRGAAIPGTTTLPGGYFRGPLGYIVGGFGALFFLLYGLMDQWWHTVYGFDVTLVSPPHVGLIFSIMVSMAGCLIALSWHVRTAQANGPATLMAMAGCALAAAVLVMFITPTLTELLPWALFGRVSWPNVVVSALFPATLLMLAVVARRPGAGTLFGLIFTLLDLLLTTLIPAITRDYAASIGLFMRDNARGEVVVSALAPTYVLLAGVAVDVVLAIGRRFGWRVSGTVALAGAVAALALRLPEADLPLYQPSPFYPVEIQQEIAGVSASVAVASLVLAPLIGAAAGWLGWLLGIVILGRDEESAATRPNRGHPLSAAAAALLIVLLPFPVLAHPSDPHHETIPAGPYIVVAGFSEWPMRAERSLDITFEPEGGIADKRAFIRILDPQGDAVEIGPLGRHPRQRDLWGLDLIALPAPGAYTIELEVDGPEGTGTGVLTGIMVGERPGPPPLPFWVLATLPLFFLIALALRGWRAIRPTRSLEARAWA